MCIKLPESQLTQYREVITRAILDAVHIAQWRCFYGKPRLVEPRIDLQETMLEEIFPGFEDLNELLGSELRVTSQVSDDRSVPHNRRHLNLVFCC